MKKSLLALAVLGAFTGTAVAQSSVTLFGIVDVNGRYVKNDDQRKRLSLSQDGINSSRLGFRGIEDLGGGLRAGFWLEAGVNPDVGTTNAKFFNRRSTVSLISNAGELRLGRDYVPTFWNETIFDAFGTNGLGSSINIKRYVHVRQDNSIGYFLPANIGGFYGQAMISASEGTATSGAGSIATSGDRPGRYLGARLGFAAGPFDIAIAGASQRFTTTLATPPLNGIAPGDNVKTFNVGGSWDFGFVKVLGWVERNNFENADETQFSISAQTTFGQNQIRVGYNRENYDPDGGSELKAHQIAATYQYNLSKRTAMYGTISWLDNKSGSTLALPQGFGAPGSGDSSKGFEIGVRHIF